VGLRGGPIGGIVVRLLTNDGLEGIGSVGNGSALYILEYSLKPIVLGADPFDVELLWEQMFRALSHSDARTPRSKPSARWTSLSGT
jgi:L-alanine-DL-glutamate epimerase-like enolase superfamily enzyme